MTTNNATFSIAAHGTAVLGLPVELDEDLQEAQGGENWEDLERRIDAAVAAMLATHGVSPEGEWLGVGVSPEGEWFGVWSAVDLVRAALGGDHDCEHVAPVAGGRECVCGDVVAD
jgi:hypothetical protein